MGHWILGHLTRFEFNVTIDLIIWPAYMSSDTSNCQILHRPSEIWNPLYPNKTMDEFHTELKRNRIQNEPLMQGRSADVNGTTWTINLFDNYEIEQYQSPPVPTKALL